MKFEINSNERINKLMIDKELLELIKNDIEKLLYEKEL